MNDKELTIVFVKNPVPGNVKQRLAEKVGDHNALKIYHFLLDHTLDVTKNLDTKKAVYYSDTVPSVDEWKENDFTQHLQQGDDLGIRMRNAFAQSFEQGYEKVVLVGSDIFNLRTGIIQKAFADLLDNNAVIGPAMDGGYYLIGMSSLFDPVFYNKTWSTHTVFKETIADFQDAQLQFKLLPVLNDIDTFEDLQHIDELTSLLSFEEVMSN